MFNILSNVTRWIKVQKQDSPMLTLGGTYGSIFQPGFFLEKKTDENVILYFCVFYLFQKKEPKTRVSHRHFCHTP